MNTSKKFGWVYFSTLKYELTENLQYRLCIFGTNSFVVKKLFLILILIIQLLVFLTKSANAQCSICTKTASQLGEGPAKGLNSGIIYLMLTPFVVAGLIGLRWWKREKEVTRSQ